MDCKNIKNVIGIFIFTVMLLLPMQVQAVDNKGSFVIESQKVVNTNIPEEARISLTETVQAPVFKASSNYSAYSLEELKNVIKSNMNNRITNFTVDYINDTSGLNIGDIIDKILSEDDYLSYSYKGYELSAKVYSYKAIITFSFGYYTTKAQEDFVDSEVSSILGRIISPGMSDDKKEKSIHDYIVSNVQYDESHTRFSAYNALEGSVVCNGYALLTYKMLTRVGIENKIVPGDANNGQKTERHAWNLVKLDGKWYHLDCTWDDPVPDVKGRVLYDYYNIPDSKMQLDHTWDPSNYPSATTVYKEPSSENPVQISVSGVNLSSESLVLKIGQSSSLKATITPTDAYNKNIFWASSDSSIATVDSNGNVKALKEGNATVSVKTADGGYIDSCEINVVSGDGVNIDFSNYKKWNNISNVSKDKNWSVKFTKPFNVSTVNSSNILVFEQYNSLLYPIKDISITYNENNDTIYVKPLNQYTAGKTYCLVITQNVLSKDGKVIPKPIVLNFKIEV